MSNLRQFAPALIAFVLFVVSGSLLMKRFADFGKDIQAVSRSKRQAAGGR